MECAIVRRIAGATLVAAGAVVSSCQQQHFDDAPRLSHSASPSSFATVVSSTPTSMRRCRTVRAVRGWHGNGLFDSAALDARERPAARKRDDTAHSRHRRAQRLGEPSRDRRSVGLRGARLMTDANNEYRYSNLYPRIRRTAALPSRP